MPYLKDSAPKRLFLPSSATEWEESPGEKGQMVRGRPLVGEYWAEMKPMARQADAEAAQAAMMEVNLDMVEAARHALSTNGGGSAVRQAVTPSKLEWQAYQRTLALRLITRWNLTDEQDQELPCDEGSWAQLDPEDAQFLAAEAMRRLRRRRPEDEPPFAKPSKGSSAAIP